MSRILLVHGWSFDPSMWVALRGAEPAHEWFTLDLGYFGRPRLVLPPELDLVVGHSFGCLWAMEHPGLEGIPLVAVNGFPRFAASADFPQGTPLRVLDRMLKRMEEAPEEVLGAFHARCGTTPPPGEPHLPRLAADLRRMRDGDARLAFHRQPILACAAADDPLVSSALARAVFGDRLRMLPTGGHVLPLTRPEAVLETIRAGLGR